uniref:Methionine aminopeptidase 1D, mitochondrial n=1 Tax=Lygus hesperus TaxID=30085 RepID=A0A0A9XBF0_LYGHE
MFTVGTTDSKYLRLIAATREALHAAVAVCKPDAPFSTIGDAIQTVADRYGCVSVKEFVGHGIGHHMHMPPQIHHYRNSYPGTMKPGMTFTIEPIFILVENVVPEQLVCLPDGWTIVTKYGSWSAQVEDVIAITEDGHEILTRH